MGTPALKEPVTKPTMSRTVLREQSSWIDIVAATVVALVVAILTPAVSSIHPLIAVAITPMVTALITVSVRRVLITESDESDEVGEPPSARRPPPLLHGGIVIALVAAVLAFAAAVVLVTAQDLIRGRSLDEGTLVGQRIDVPDVTDQPGSRALDAIHVAGLEPKRELEYSDGVPEFRVVRTDPAAGSSVRKGSAVVVVISQGKRPVSEEPQPIRKVRVPAVIAKPVAEAMAALDDVGLEPSVASTAEGVVTKVHPDVGEKVTVGSNVILSVAPPVEMPAVEGQSLNAALDALNQLQLTAKRKFVDPPNGVEPGIVTDSRPAAGTPLAQNSVVTLTVSALLVPDVVGQPEGEAKNELTEAGFTITVRQQDSNTVDVGAVIATNPPATQRRLTRDITIFVSSGPATPNPDPRGPLPRGPSRR